MNCRSSTISWPRKRRGESCVSRFSAGDGGWNSKRRLMPGPQLGPFRGKRSSGSHRSLQFRSKGALLLATHLLNFAGPETQNFSITPEGGQQISFDRPAARFRRVNHQRAGRRRVKELALQRRRSGCGLRLAISFRHHTRAGGSPSRPFCSGPALRRSMVGLVESVGRNQVVSVALLRRRRSVITSSPNQQTVEGRSGRFSRNRPRSQRGRRSGPAAGAVRAGDVGAFHVCRGPHDAEVWAWNRDTMGKPLNEVRRLHLQLVGESISSDEFAKQLRERLAADQNLKLSDAEQADAALKISVSPASSRAGDSRVIVSVRGVNASGFVVWPASRRGSSWRYVGQPRFVADRIVTDLMADIRRGSVMRQYRSSSVR